MQLTSFTIIVVLALLPQPRIQSTAIFKDVAAQSGLKFQHYNGMTGKFYLPEITGSGGALFDFDNDGDLDVYLVQGNVLEPNTKPAVTMFPWRSPQPPRGRLFRNELGRPGVISFTDVTEESGILATGYGMGAAVGDINNDGLPDLYLTNLGSNQMFHGVDHPRYGKWN